MIKVENLTKSFDGRTVLNNISVEFPEGQTNLVIGQSGSGKSVFLKNLIGLLQPDEGKILFDERDITKMNFKQKKDLRKEIGLVFQGGALFDSSTVLENVLFPLEMFTKMTKKERLKRAQFCIDRVELNKANNLYPSEISGGMQKRVAIARAIALNPKYLFCDEPNSGLDPRTSLVIDKLIREITEEFNITTIVITHDMNSVMEMGAKIMFVYQGNKWWEGSKEELFKTNNKELNDFVFASSLFKKVKNIVSEQ